VNNFKYLKSLLSELITNEGIYKTARNISAGSITIDLYELESLVNPDKFDFDNKSISTIGVDLNEE
jgi:hypothetical protein